MPGQPAVGNVAKGTFPVIDRGRISSAGDWPGEARQIIHDRRPRVASRGTAPDSSVLARCHL
jgi:hypothetical protein